jgi:hypothetical protein
VAGLPTNLGFLQDLSAHPAFAVDLDLDTGFIERHRASLLPLDESVAPEVAALAGALWGKLSVSVLLLCCSKGRFCQVTWAVRVVLTGVEKCEFVNGTNCGLQHICVGTHANEPGPVAFTAFLVMQAAAASGDRSQRGGAMAAWDAGDSKRLWHKLVRRLPVRLAESEQQMELQVTHVSASGFEVG